MPTVSQDDVRPVQDAWGAYIFFQNANLEKALFYLEQKHLEILSKFYLEKMDCLQDI